METNTTHTDPYAGCAVDALIDRVQQALTALEVTYSKYQTKGVGGVGFPTRWEINLPESITGDHFFHNADAAGFTTRKSAMMHWAEWSEMASTREYITQFIIWGLSSKWLETLATGLTN